MEKRLAEAWQSVLGVEKVGVHDNFFELGGHSLLASRVATRLSRELEVRLPLAQLFAKPTIAGLADALEAQSEAAELPMELELPEVVADPENRHEPFPLTEMQQAQWIGRIGSFDIGDVAAHVYFETESDELDLGRLEGAWQRMIERHEMLRAVVLLEGQQRILAEVPPFRIALDDLRDQSPTEVASRLEETRERLSHQLRPVDSWPLFGISASLLPGGRVRLHLSFELLISDIASLRILLREWSEVYADPDREFEPLELSYRDYVLAENRLRESDAYRRSLLYWQERLADLPPAPELPLAKDPSAIDRPRFERWATRVEAADWQRMKDFAARFGISHSAVLLAIYARVLGTWSKNKRFSVNVTIINRLPMHPQVGKLVGEFASFAPAAIDLRQRPTFEELARQVQEQSWSDLEHRFTHGVRILRELARAQGGTSGATMPVVFTSTLIHAHDRDQPLPIGWLGEA
ncbi:MAG: condensation domain-containing protein, partial [Holophagales bacterium]|nr:condensation domain-containing protein [Holophagales bacterium]